MTKLLFLILCVLVLAGCRNNSGPQEGIADQEKMVNEDQLFGMDFRNYRDLDPLATYNKQIDTSIFMGGQEDNYRLLNLRQNNENLVLFYKVADRNSSDAEVLSYRAVDTLEIRPKKDESISVGYCYHKDYYEGELVALVRTNDSLQISELIQVWRANPDSESFEIIENFKGITCLNETYEGKETSLRHLNLQSRTNQ